MTNATEPSPSGTPIHVGPTTKLRMTTGTAMTIMGSVVLAVWVAASIYNSHNAAIRDIGYLKRCMRILFRHEGIPIPEEKDASDEGVFPTAATSTNARRPQ